MPPRFVRQLRNNTAQSLVHFVKLGTYLGVRLANAHFEYAHTVYKYAPNKFSFRAQPKNFVIQSVSEESRGNETTTYFFAPAPQLFIIHYSLLIINSLAVAARAPSLKLHIPFISALRRSVGAFLRYIIYKYSYLLPNISKSFDKRRAVW